MKFTKIAMVVFGSMLTQMAHASVLGKVCSGSTNFSGVDLPVEIRINGKDNFDYNGPYGKHHFARTSESGFFISDDRRTGIGILLGVDSQKNVVQLRFSLQGDGSTLPVPVNAMVFSVTLQCK